MKRLMFLIAALGLMVLFSGCGQSGPLYLPGNPSQMAAPPSQESSSEQVQGEEETGESSETD